MCFSKFFKKKKKLPQLIRFEGKVEDLVWYAPCNEIKANNTLDVVVTQDYEAECSLNGVRKIYTSGRFEFSAGFKDADVEILYVRKDSVVSLKWGTPNPIDIIDPIFEMPIRLGASGEAKVSIFDTQLFKRKLVAGARTYSEDHLADFCRTEIATHLATSLSNVLKENGLSYFDISSQLVGLSYLIKKKIEEFFVGYGLKLEHFLMATVKMWDEGALERITADREFSRRYKERELLLNKLRAEQKEDEKDDLKNQLELLRALGDYNSKLSESNKRDVNITIVSAQHKAYCKYCGTKIDGETVFCSKCGKKVKAIEE